MALVRQIRPVEKERQAVHGETECSSSVFRAGGATYLQLDTYGSPERKHPEKVSQSLQFDENSAGQLLELIRRTFPNLP